MTRAPRAVVVVTGSELVRGDRRDLNGPFLAAELLRRGIEPARIVIVGDREDELTGALEEGLRADLCLTSGGLGPTHDDRTVELVARAAGVGLHVDDDLQREIGGISRAFARRMNRPYVDFEPGVRKQATIPDGALSLGLAGTAPGLVLEAGECVVVVLPGPPGELQRLWLDAVESEPVRRVLARAQPPDVRLLRFFGASESAVAKALADAGGDGNGVEATICARDFEIHVDLYVQPGAEARAEELTSGLVAPLERYLFSRDERRVEQLVLDACLEQGLTLATAESCTGGMVAQRLTSVPGERRVFLGGVVAYSNEVKTAELGVPLECWSGTGRCRQKPPLRWRPERATVSGPTSPWPSRVSRGRMGGARRSPSGSSTSTRRAPPARAAPTSSSQATGRASGAAPPSRRCIW